MGLPAFLGANVNIAATVCKNISRSPVALIRVWIRALFACAVRRHKQ